MLVGAPPPPKHELRIIAHAIIIAGAVAAFTNFFITCLSLLETLQNSN
jgi:hypothetical protein